MASFIQQHWLGSDLVYFRCMLSSQFPAERRAYRSLSYLLLTRFRTLLPWRNFHTSANLPLFVQLLIYTSPHPVLHIILPIYVRHSSVSLAFHCFPSSRPINFSSGWCLRPCSHLFRFAFRSRSGPVIDCSRAFFAYLTMRGTPINRSIWTCRQSNNLWKNAMKWWTFGDMKNGLGIYECHGQLERFRNGSSRAFTPQSQPDPFRNRSTAITSRGGRLVPERPDAVEQVWTRAPGCVPEPFRSQTCGVNTALVLFTDSDMCNTLIWYFCFFSKLFANLLSLFLMVHDTFRTVCL